jgi:NDP-sugar pyrophosphorylase family protein
MIDLGGAPLIEHVLVQFECAGIEHVTVALREDDLLLKDFLRTLIQQDRFRTVDQVLSTTAGGAGKAMRSILERVGSKPMLLSTVDFVGSEGLAADLVATGEACARSTIGVLAVARLIRDSYPMWVSMSDGFVTEFGKDLGDTGLVFGNIRWLSARALGVLSELPGWMKGSTDSALIRELVHRHATILAAKIYDPIFDVDDARDLELATDFLLGQGLVRSSRVTGMPTQSALTRSVPGTPVAEFEGLLSTEGGLGRQ